MRLYEDTSWWLLLAFDDDQIALAEAAGLAAVPLARKPR
jgi:hypothetical protein